MLVSYHCHSRWSDGEGEIEDFVHAARTMRLDEFGPSDHYVLSPANKLESWSMPLDALDAYVESVQKAAGHAGDSTIVRLGLEADYFPETAEELRRIIASYPFDYVIGSVHRLDGFPIDDVAEDWLPLTEAEKNDIIRRYWVRVKEMAQSQMFDIAGHIDLVKKFDVWPTIDISKEISAALDAIADAGMSFELNTSGWYKPCREAYPSHGIVRGCLQRGIPVLISADAHKPQDLIRAYDRAERLLIEVGYTEAVSYAGRQMVFHPFSR
ncbi:MAG: histidinol-phosphatase HisJ family protein [Armatimonadota bacterium]